MAHFAQIKDEVVQAVIVVANEVLLDEDGIEQESIGKEFCTNNFGGDWVQTSYNAKIRGQYAAAGMKYDSEQDEFVTITES
jgi:membrane peptidoglycan carboxypeptidase